MPRAAPRFGHAPAPWVELAGRIGLVFGMVSAPWAQTKLGADTKLLTALLTYVLTILLPSGHPLLSGPPTFSTLGPLWLTPIGPPAVPSPAATGDGDGVCEAVWPPGVSREQVARFIHERVTQLSSLQTPRVNKGAMREKRESPSLVAMRARGALLAMCERSPSRAHRDLESALATPSAAYLELAGRSPRPTA